METSKAGPCREMDLLLYLVSVSHFAAFPSKDLICLPSHPSPSQALCLGLLSYLHSDLMRREEEACRVQLLSFCECPFQLLRDIPWQLWIFSDGWVGLEIAFRSACFSWEK